MFCIIDCGTSWMEDIKKNLSDLGQSSKIIKIAELKNYDFSPFSGIIISGGPTLLSKINWKKFIEPFKFIKTTKIPILGICLGHQTIGLLYGAEISGGKLISKKEPIEILSKEKLFLNLENPPIFREDHSEHITIPREFVLLGKSNSCANEAMKHENKNIYSVQFHPEVSGENGKKLFQNFIKICTKSMKTPPLVRIDLDKPIMELVSKTDHRTLGIWAADCAERVLHYFEEKYPEDKRPRKALEALRTWVQTGAFKMADVRRDSLAAHAAARSVKENNHAARSAARSAGQAVATAHVPTHAIGAAVYAATAVRDATNSPEETSKERNWQYQHLLDLNKTFGTNIPAKQKLWRSQ